MNQHRARVPLTRVSLFLCAAATAVVWGAGPVAGAASAPLPPVVAPLAGTLSSASGDTAVVPMGQLGEPLNTFWQLFVRPAGATRWDLVTPPGVADNGGLVVDEGTGTLDPSTVLAGFEPSQSLTFSPLALSTDQGTTWSPGLLGAGLAAVPDALAGAPGTRLVALARTGGGTVLTSSGSISAWSTVARRSAIASSPAGRACRVGRLTAVAFDPAGNPLVGASCTTPGTTGLFERAHGRWVGAGPVLGDSSLSTVLRLADVEGAVDGLVALTERDSTTLVAVTRTTAAGRPWSVSPPLLLDRGDRLLSTGVAAGGGFVVLATRTDGRLVLVTESAPAAPWHALPPPPRGTAAVVVEASGAVDALVVASTRFVDQRLDVSTGQWSILDSQSVPIDFGSSS